MVVGEGPSQLIVYGQSSGSTGDTFHVVYTETFQEVVEEKGIQNTLSGGGPFMFAYMGPSQFQSSSGETASADISVGSTDDPNVLIAVMWTSEINGVFPSVEALNNHGDVLTVLGGQSVELEGWIQFANIWLANNDGNKNPQWETLSFHLFHQGDKIYGLGFLPNYQANLPKGDLNSVNKYAAYSGQKYTYKVKGFLSGQITLALDHILPQAIPLILVSSIERQP